jgi:hypothetical protein
MKQWKIVRIVYSPEFYFYYDKATLEIMDVRINHCSWASKEKIDEVLADDPTEKKD